MKRLGIVLAAMVSMAGLAQAADIPTKKAPVAAPKPNCWESLWTYLNSSADDCPLSYAGITLYGTLDVGYGYQEWGVKRNPSADKLNYFVQKTGHEHIWQPTYNALSTNVVGLKMKEDLGRAGLPGWSLVGVLEAGVNPYSGMFNNPVRSLADNNTTSSNGLVTFKGRNFFNQFQTANYDSGRNGAWDNSQGFVGVSNATWGTLTFGRTNTLAFDTTAKYDPMLNSLAFSMIGFSGSFPGFGDTELSRINTALTYRVAIPNVGAFSAVRLAGQAQIGGYGVQNASMASYWGQAGFDWGNFSFDGVVGWAKDAVSLSTFNGANNAQFPGDGYFINVNNAYFDPNKVLKATLSNNFGTELGASYKWDRLKFYGGYIYARDSNPTDSFLTGFRTIYPAVSVPAGFFSNGLYTNNAVTSNAYNYNKILQTFWTGVKWSALDNLDFIAAFYYQTQNNFNFTVTPTGITTGAPCTGTGAFISSNKCGGGQSAVSFLVDWRPVKRVDIFAGVMFSNVYGGLANGFFFNTPVFNPVTKTIIAVPHTNTQNWDPTIGIRVRF
jgi:predicted porin